MASIQASKVSGPSNCRRMAFPSTREAPVALLSAHSGICSRRPDGGRGYGTGSEVLTMGELLPEDTAWTTGKTGIVQDGTPPMRIDGDVDSTQPSPGC